MAATIKGNDFGVFLDVLGEGNKTPPQSSASPNVVLEYLLSHDGPIPVAEILDQTPISISSFAAMLDTLVSAKLVKLTTAGTSERLELTDIGRKVAELGLIGTAQ